MSGRGRGYRLAVERAEQARARFLSDLGATRNRASPGRLMQDVRNGAKARAKLAGVRTLGALQDRRVGIGAVVLVIAAFIFRRPIAALSRRSWVGLRSLWTAFRQRRQDDGE